MPADEVDGRRTVDLNRAYGAKAATAPAHKPAAFIVQGPAETGERAGMKNAERLRILVRSPTYQNAEKVFFDRIEPRLRTGTTLAARRVGYGPWKKRFSDSSALVAALQENFLPTLSRDLGVQLSPLASSKKIFSSPNGRRSPASRRCIRITSPIKTLSA